MFWFKAWNARNSRAIAKFHNAETGHFDHKMSIHDLIRGSSPLLPQLRALSDVTVIGEDVIAGCEPWNSPPGLAVCLLLVNSMHSIVRALYGVINLGGQALHFTCVHAALLPDSL